jgi:hypothetical protein
MGAGEPSRELIGRGCTQ